MMHGNIGWRIKLCTNMLYFDLNMKLSIFQAAYLFEVENGVDFGNIYYFVQLHNYIK